MIKLHLLADLEKSFLNYYLRPFDTKKGLIIEVYNTSLIYLEKLKKGFETSLIDNFVHDLYEDDYGNVIMKKAKGTIALHCTHRHRRNVNSKLEEIIARGQELKEKIIDNFIENIIDQCQKNKIVEYASAFDLNFQIDMKTRLEYIKQLHSIYGITYNQEVINESNAYFENFKINTKYPAKMDCTVEKLLE